MPPHFQSLLTRFSTNAPADNVALKEFEVSSRLTLPKAYKYFLKVANGGDGFIGKDRYIILWQLEELLGLNRAYNVQQFAPGLFLFGTNRGGEAYGFDMRSRTTPIVSVPFIGMAIEAASPICPDFETFLKGEFQLSSQ